MRPGNLEKANLKLQIKNTEVEINILFEKLDHLTDKLKKLAGTKSGKRQAKK